MTIRNIITAAAVAGLLGLSATTAYADNGDSFVDDQGFQPAADANYPGAAFVYNGDADVNEGDILSGGREQARLQESRVEALEIR